MPELPEVESARLVIAGHALHRPVVQVASVDSYVARPLSQQDFRRLVVGRELTGVERIGKQLLLTVADQMLGLHLGMGGQIVVSGVNGHIAREADSTHGLAGAHQSQWDRFVLRFSDGTALRLVDKRRLGRVTIDPDITTLGPDVLQANRAQFDVAVLGSRSPVKARLLDQTAISGIGNLIADETLWRSKIAPTRSADSLTTAELRILFRSARQACRYAIENGGSHTGRLIAHRHEGGHCPRCGSLLAYVRVAGRSTWSCPSEQR